MHTYTDTDTDTHTHTHRQSRGPERGKLCSRNRDTRKLQGRILSH